MTQNSLKISDVVRRDLGPVGVNLDRKVYCLFGIPVDALSFEETVGELKRAIVAGERCTWSTPNLNFLTSCQKSPKFRDMLGKSQLSTVDGMPLVIMSRWLGIPIKERVPGSTVFDAMMSGAVGPMSVYFFGGADGVAARASQRLPEVTSFVRSAGSFSPGYGSIESMSQPEILGDINSSRADLLVLALNAKRGHSWIELNAPHLNVPIIAHLGSVINFVAGTVRRSPEFLQKMGLEWLWRIWEEPYLASRYRKDFVDLTMLMATKVVPLLLVDPMIRRAARRKQSFQLAREVGANQTVLALAGNASTPHLAEVRDLLKRHIEDRGDLVISLADVTYVDAALLGLLIIAKGWREEHGLSVRITPPRRGWVHRLIKLHCVDYLFCAAA